ncbi:MAG: hypothetical protein JKX73_03045 [Flavobacteriales bacterium]|nr:hypothetical protein [Flavobacteriales bacterium]
MAALSRTYAILLSASLTLTFPFITLAQDAIPGEIHGNFQMDMQYYNSDTIIGAPDVPEKVLSRGFSNLNYTLGNFTAGVRFESYLNTLQGFDPRYEGTAFPYRYATYKVEGMEITVGNFYEQFGNGLIFRSYEEWGLGYDNVMDGIRVKGSPYKGVYVKGIIGKQRSFMSQGPGIVRGFDAELVVNELFDSSEAKSTLILGGSFISKYQVDQDPIYILPENVGAWAGRVNFISGKFNLNAEYAYKINDPSLINGYIYKPGESLMLSASYSKKGFGLIVSAKRIDNMDFRSDRSAGGTDLSINYLPSTTKVHTYSLAAYYPYATQPNGEMGMQIELFYKFKKGSALGGKYGTGITINYSTVSSLAKEAINDTTQIGETGTLGYKSDFLAIGDEAYFSDFNIDITKKFSKKIKAVFSYVNLLYNKDVVQGLSGYGTVFADIGIIDITYKIKSKRTLRMEFQRMSTMQDDRSWVQVLAEYTMAPNWFFAVFDEHNYNNIKSEKRLHYFTIQGGYKKKGNTITVGYGRQRAGIFCVGGVCRNVPASNGITLALTSSF